MEHHENSSRTLEEEIRSVREYLGEKASDDEEGIGLDFRVDPKADTQILIPATLIKSFVENSIINEISQQSGERKIDICIYRTTLGILIMITGNTLLRYQEYGRGRMIGNRLELLDQSIIEFNDKQPYSVSYQLLDHVYTESGQMGTRVLITIVL